MLGAMRGQVNESHGVGGASRGWLAINLSLLALYRQVRRCRAFKWTEKFPAGALAMVDLDEVVAFAAEPNGLSVQFLWKRKRI